MTVASTTSRMPAYAGNGSADTFPYSFKILDADHLRVIVVDDVGAETVLTRITHYTVTGVGDAAGGNIVLVDGDFDWQDAGGDLDTGWSLVPIRVPSMLQEAAYADAGRYAGRDAEKDLDRAAMRDLWLQDQVARCLKFPDSEAGTAVAVTLPNAVDRALQMLGFDADGNATAAQPSSTPISSVMQAVVAAATLALARAAMGPWGDALVTATGASTARALAARFAEQFNVKDYGAVGDGTTDDAAAIQAAITAAQAVGGAVFFPAALYRITTQLTITANVSLIGLSKPGPRVYTSSTVYGGAEIRPDWAVASNVATSAFGLKIDVGTIGSEGYANVLVQGLGFGHTDADGGGIYVEASVGVTIKECRFTGDVDQWTATTANGIGIYARDMIVGRISDCQFFRMGWGIIADDYFNENAIEHCDFFNCYNLPIGIWAATNDCLRNSIRRNNFIGDPGGVRSTAAIKIAGKADGCTIAENTFEAIRSNPIQVNDTHPLTAASLGVFPTSVIVRENVFIACCGGQAGGAAIDVGASVNHVIAIGNRLHNPTVNCTAMVSVQGSSTFVYAYANEVGSKLHVRGTPAVAVVDEQYSRWLPRDTVEDSTTGKSGLASTDPARLWQNGTSIRVWNGVNKASLSQFGVATDTGSDATPSAVGITLLICNNSADYNITAIDDGVAGQMLEIENSAAGFSPTLVNSASLKLDGSANKVLAHAGGGILMMCLGGNVWKQIAPMTGP